jgi:uncharacterized protein YndB with AHSA1/START domain
MTERKVNFSLLVRATPARVYDALTTSDGLDAWFTHGATVEARPGGRIKFRWKNWGPYEYTGENGGPVLEAKRPERFAFQWKADSGGYDTTVEIDFEPRETGTFVRLVEYGYEEGPTGLQDLLNRATGWGCVLTLMKFYVEHGIRY